MHNIKLLGSVWCVRALAVLLIAFAGLVLVPESRSQAMNHGLIGAWGRGGEHLIPLGVVPACLLASVGAWKLSDFLSVRSKISASEAKGLTLSGTLFCAASITLGAARILSSFAMAQSGHPDGKVKIGFLIGTALFLLFGVCLRRIGTVLAIHIGYREELESFV